MKALVILSLLLLLAACAGPVTPEGSPTPSAHRHGPPAGRTFAIAGRTRRAAHPYPDARCVALARSNGHQCPARAGG